MRGIKPDDFIRQIEDLPRRLDSRIAATHNHESQQHTALRALGHGIGFLKAIDDAAAQFQGVANILHEKRMFRHSRNSAEIDDAAEREHEVLEIDAHAAREIARLQLEPARGEIDPDDVRPKHGNAPAEKPQRVHDVPRREGGADDFREHRLKYHEVFARDQRHTPLGLLTQFPGERPGAIDTCKTAAGDDDIKLKFG